MKKVINILLILCIAGLAYIYYGSIMGPINFEKEKSIRDNAVIAKLKAIKDAQAEYNNAYGMGYCDNFDTLIAFVKEGRLPIVRKIGTLTDDQLEANWTEGKILKLYEEASIAEELSGTLSGVKARQKAQLAKELWDSAANAGFVTYNEDGSRNYSFYRDTVWVDMMDSLFHGTVNVDSLCYVPFTDGKQFELSISADTSVKTGLVQYSFAAQAPFEWFLGGLDKQEIINLLEQCDDRGSYRGLKVTNESGNWE